MGDLENPFPNLPLSPSRTFADSQNKRRRTPDGIALGSPKKKEPKQLTPGETFFRENKRKAMPLCRYLLDSKVIKDCDDLSGLKLFVQSAIED